MSGQDLIIDLQSLLAKLNRALVEMTRRGRDYAQAEHDYRVALAKKMLQLRAEGIPATISQDVCRGEPEIAKLRLQRDIAQTIHEAAQETIRVWKLEATLMEAQISREWGRKE